jgi:prepilin-type N-terminal cleavage/methylation domain-containing protein/prepilin-type processing-associated H-X9-DG protein
MRATQVTTCRIVVARSAVTLIELLVVLTIIATLVALTIPALNGARESARRTDCQNNMRQLSLAMSHFRSTYKQYPTNGGFFPGNTIKSRQGHDEEISTLDYSDNVTRKWGIGNPRLPPDKQTGSWAYTIMPLIDQWNAFQYVRVDNEQPLFLCPSRARRGAAVPINDQYGEYAGAGWAWTKTDYCANLKASPNAPDPPCVDLAYSEILLGEKAFDPNVQRPNSWYWDEPLFSGGSWGTVRSGKLIINDGVGIDFKNNWGSAHRGGANFAFGDGRVDMLSDKIDYGVTQ